MSDDSIFAVCLAAFGIAALIACTISNVAEAKYSQPTVVYMDDDDDTDI